MKLVHDDFAEGRVGPQAERILREDFCRAAENWGVAVDRGVARGQAHIVRPEITAESKKLFIHQGLDRTGVNRSLARRQRPEMEGRRDQ